MSSSQELLRDELAKLQQQVDALGAGDLAEAVAKLQDQVAKVTKSVEDASNASSSNASSSAAAATATALKAGYDASKVGGRQKIGAEDMSAEVVDTNPYSRLMALQRMGIVTEVGKGWVFVFCSFSRHGFCFSEEGSPACVGKRVTSSSLCVLLSARPRANRTHC
jgi:hypothetical protein